MDNRLGHVSVLKKEVIKYLDPKPNENFIDCTFGSGGHTKAILEKNRPRGKVLGIELDPVLYEKARKEFSGEARLILVNDNFAHLEKIVERHKFGLGAGILLDLGMASWHLEESGRGFSFQRDEPLVMTYEESSQTQNSLIQGAGRPVRKRKTQNHSSKLKTKLTAKKIVNEWSREEIERVLKEYGEERFARRIAKAITTTRREKSIQTTFQLVAIVRRAVPSWYRHQKIHFATRTFQALRIAVNQELENLKQVLSQAVPVLSPRGRLVVISFHSLEDRIVKNFFREQENERQLKILTKKPIIPRSEEVELNPRSRSAKLRAAQKI